MDQHIKRTSWEQEMYEKLYYQELEDEKIRKINRIIFITASVIIGFVLGLVVYVNVFLLK